MEITKNKIGGYTATVKTRIGWRVFNAPTRMGVIKTALLFIFREKEGSEAVA